METTIEQKRSKAHSVLKLAMFLSATTLIGTILLVILSKAAGIEILEAIGADLLGGRSRSGSGTAIFVTVMLLFMLTMAIAQGIYAQSIGELAAAHLDEEEYYPLKRVRNGAYVQLAALVLLMLTPFLGNALASTDSLILVFAVLISPWIVAIVGTIMMRSGFKSLYFCENTTGIRLEGTENLRHTATCQLRLLFMPLVFLLFGVLMTVLLFKSLHSTWDGSGFYALSLDQLFQSIRDFKGRSGSTISTLRTFYYIYAIALAVFMFFTFLWYFFMLVKPVTGWNRFMKGLTAEENETETGTGGNRIANSLERLRNWHYYVVAGILVALMFLPLFKGSKKSPHNDEYVYNWNRNKIERQRNEVKVNSSSNEIIGYDTDYDPNGNVLIMTNRGGVMIDTGIEIDSNWGNISDQHDYNGDGNMDALVSWSIGAGYPGNMFIVYYDKVLCKFKRTEDFEPDCRPACC